MIPRRMRDKIRFRKVSPLMTACWVWTGYINPDGYAVVSADGQPQAAHRVVWEKLRGPIPKGTNLKRLCPTKECVNPNHLVVRGRI